MMPQNHAYSDELEDYYNDTSMEVVPSKKKRIMIIDDDQDFRLSLSELLVDEGFAVMTARDGETGLNQLVHQNDLPDLILVDLLMPIKSGMEFRREQLQMDEISDIPVVFITGQGYIEGETCLLKPFDERELIELVKEHLGMI